MASSYLMQALNLYDLIPIKTVRSLLSGKVLRTTSRELELQYGDASHLFIYRFGCVVFFNLPAEIVDAELAKIRSALGPGLPNPTSESYQLNVGEAATKVEFEFAEIKKIDLDHLRMIAVTLGQSAALEYFELGAEKMVSDNSQFMRELAAKGRVPLHSKELVKIIGSTASTRQHMISNLSILDPPDETWKSKDLERFFKEVQTNFDIDTRFRTLDRKLTLVQDNIEILANLTAVKRNTFLEAMIVGLIIFELALALIARIH